VIEHLLKDVDDLKAYLSLPAPALGEEIDTSGVLQAEAALGDSGIVLIDTPDPLCMAASLFHMEEYTIIALTEPVLFHQLLERFAELLFPQIVAISQALPGHLWRIFGPEYASPPYLPPRLFREYVVRYDTHMVEAIQRQGGFARIHSHGRLRHILDDIAATGCTALDPIEPPPQGDVELRFVRQKYGKQMVLFGNIEASDIEMLPTADFEKKVVRALKEGTEGEGRGFVLMPSSCPYGRVLTPLALANYEKMVELIERF
jgi:uroporphyrinogen-III decarboxylase